MKALLSLHLGATKGCNNNFLTSCFSVKVGEGLQLLRLPLPVAVAACGCRCLRLFLVLAASHLPWLLHLE